MNYFNSSIQEKPISNHFIQQEQIGEIGISLLIPHPLQNSIYGEENIEVSPVYLAIAQSGDIEAITVTPLPDGTFMIIKGHTRAKAAQKLGWESIPCRVVFYACEEDRDEAFLSSNTTRNETNEQKARRAAAWWKIIEAKNAKRQNLGRSDGTKVTTREEVARLVGGWGAVTTQKAVQVVEAIAQLPQEQGSAIASQLNSSVNKAYNSVKAQYNPRVFDRVQIIRGPFQGRVGEIRGLSGRYCLVYLDGDAAEHRESIFIHEMQPEVIAKNEPPQSVKAELRDKGQELGLKGKSQLLPSIPSNQGFNPQEYIGYTMPSQVAIAFSKFTPEQINYCLAIALPEMNHQQIQVIKESISCF